MITPIEAESLAKFNIHNKSHEVLRNRRDKPQHNKHSNPMNKSVLSGEKLETLPLKLESRYPHSYWTLGVKSSAEQLASGGEIVGKEESTHSYLETT